MLDFSGILKNLLSVKNLDLNNSYHTNNPNNNSCCWDVGDELAIREESCLSGDPVTAHAETGLEASGWSLSTVCLTDWDSIITLLVNSGPTREVQEVNFAWMDKGVALRRSNHRQQGNSDRSGTSVPFQRGYTPDPSGQLLDPSLVDDAVGAVKQSADRAMVSTAAQQFLDSLPDLSYVLC